MALFINLTIQNKVIVHQNKATFRKISWKSVSGTAVRINTFSDIQLINKKYGINTDGHIKKQP